MNVIPIRMVNLIAASVLLPDIMAAVYDDVSDNSTWIGTQQSDTTAPTGLGSYSQTLRNPSGSLELNWKNNATPGAPSATDVRMGINPDGSGDPIEDSVSPWLTAANFSGTDGGFLNSFTPGNVEFIWVEWEDAVMALFKNSTRTHYPFGWHLGTVLLPPMAAMGNSGSLRMDGNLIFSRLPSFDATPESWASTGGPIMRRRIALGQSVDILDTALAWSQAQGGRRLTTIAPATSDSSFKYGPAQERVVWPVIYRNQSSSFGSDEGWMAKYLRLVPAVLPPTSIWRVAGLDQYLVIGRTTGNGSLAIPMIDGFQPTPP